jgi:hypothetical protein
LLSAALFQRALLFGSVVAFASENLKVVVVGFDFDFAEFAIVGRVCRVVA